MQKRPRTTMFFFFYITCECVCVVKWEQRDTINKFPFSVMTTSRGDHTCRTEILPTTNEQITFYDSSHSQSYFFFLQKNALETNKMAALPTSITNTKN